MKNKVLAKLDNALMYHVYPSSFADSNGDGMGDLNGITEHLDYLEWLGCDYLWVSPVFASEFQDGGYDIKDFRKISPRFGAQKDAVKLIKAAKKKNIGVLFDLVAGHTSNRHPWFLDSSSTNPGPYRDYYVWSNHTFEELKAPGQFIGGMCPRDGMYLANFFPFQPALNYGYAAPEYSWQHHYKDPVPRKVKKELYAIMCYWLDQGVAGFRVDLASTLIKGDATGEVTREFWQEIRSWLERDYPEAILVAEWSKPDHAIPAGFHVDFLLHSFSDAYNALFRYEKGMNIIPSDGNSYFRKAGRGDVSEFVGPYLKLLEAVGSKGFISIPTGNHDLPRLGEGRDQRDMKLCLLFLLTQKGMPCLYYGDEIGLKHNHSVSKEGGYRRTGARTPMPWDGGKKNRGFSSAAAGKLFLPVDQETNVKEQQADPDSLLSFVRQLVAIRHDTRSLWASSDFQPLETGNYIFAFQRTHRDEVSLVAVNPGKEKLSFTVKGSGRWQSLISCGSAVAKSQGGGKTSITLAARSGAVFRLSPGDH